MGEDTTFRAVVGSWYGNARNVEAEGLSAAGARTAALGAAAVYLGRIQASRVTVEEQGVEPPRILRTVTLATDIWGRVHLVERGGEDESWVPACGPADHPPVPGYITAPVSCPDCLRLTVGYRPRPASGQVWTAQGARRARDLVVLTIEPGALGAIARCAVFKDGVFTGRECQILTAALGDGRRYVFLELSPYPRVPRRWMIGLGPFRYAIRVATSPVRWLAEAFDPLACHEGPLCTSTPTPGEEDRREFFTFASEVAKVAAWPAVIALAAQFGSTPLVVPLFAEPPDE